MSRFRIEALAQFVDGFAGLALVFVSGQQGPRDSRRVARILGLMVAELALGRQEC